MVTVSGSCFQERFQYLVFKTRFPRTDFQKSDFSRLISGRYRLLDGPFNHSLCIRSALLSKGRLIFPRINLGLFWCFFCLLGFSSERITHSVFHLCRNVASRAIGVSGHYHASHASFGPRPLKKAHYGHVSFGTLFPLRR